MGVARLSYRQIIAKVLKRELKEQHEEKEGAAA